MSAPGPVIDVDNASKWYGDVVAVNGVSVQVFPGITGLLGPNGAGKTTLLHLITGLAVLLGGLGHGAGRAVAEQPRAVPAGRRDDRKRGGLRIPHRAAVP